MTRGMSMLLLAGVLIRCGARAADGPGAEQIARMEAAAPAGARCQPAKLRKVLVFSLAWGYRHDSIPFGKKAFEILGRKTGAYEAIIDDDPAQFEPENLRRYDAVVFNNCNNEVFLPEDFEKLGPAQQAEALRRDALRKDSLVKFLQDGRGLLVIHAGLAAFREWPEYGNIIGARFENHPWASGSTVTLKVDEPAHPLAAAFRDPLFTVRDEIYQVTGPYSRTRLRVLLSIDTGRTDMTVKGIVRRDGDFAISWIKSYGRGRVFYNALGHDYDVFWNPVVLQHWLDGVQFAAGDLPADTTPSAGVVGRHE